MNAILFWNDVALEANRLSHTYGQDTSTLGPTQSSRTLAIIHLAMYEAYAAAVGNTGDLTVYDSARPAAPANAWADGAIAGAAETTIKALYPQVSVRSDFDLATKLTLATFMFGNANWNIGYQYGRTVGNHFLNLRAADPGSSDAGYVAPTGRGDHRPDPDVPNQGYHGPFYGSGSKCFAVTKRHALLPPPKPGTADYNKYLAQVKEKGIAPELMGTLPNGASKRTVDETLIGIYWGYDGASQLGTPPRLYNQIVREVSKKQGNGIAEDARLFALINVAMGDAGILAWEQKYVHNLWRPVVGIRENDPSLGLATTPSDNVNNIADIGWLPLGAPKSNVIGKNFTPPFPAYPSGHATFGAAAFQITRRFYDVPETANGSDQLFKDLSFVSEELNNVTTDNKGTVRPRHERKFTDGLWQMIIENGLSRVYLGVHWAFDAFALDSNNNPDLTQNIGGAPLGLNIANDIFNTKMKKSTV